MSKDRTCSVAQTHLSTMSFAHDASLEIYRMFSGNASQPHCVLNSVAARGRKLVELGLPIRVW